MVSGDHFEENLGTVAHHWMKHATSKADSTSAKLWDAFFPFSKKEDFILEQPTNLDFNLKVSPL